MKSAFLVGIILVLCMTICTAAALGSNDNTLLRQKVLRTPADSGSFIPGIRADPMHCNTRNIAFDADASLQIENWKQQNITNPNIISLLFVMNDNLSVIGNKYGNK